MSRREWITWLRALQQDLGARLADTIGEGDSARFGEDLAELVRGAIALEADLAAFLDEQEDR